VDTGTRQGPGALSAVSARQVAATRPPLGARTVAFVEKTATIVQLEVWKLMRDPTELVTRALQPMLWLLLFGEVFSRVRVIPTGGRPYIDFLAAGILAQSVLFVAIFYGISAIWERDLGLLQKMLVTPTPRPALILGKALSAGVRGISQAVIIYALALVLGVQTSWNPLHILGVLALVVIGAALFSTFSLAIATLVKTRERFMGIGQVLTMPLFFASNAIYPLSIMPGWLEVVSRLNPLSYEVDGLRDLMLSGGTSSFGIGVDFAVLAGVAAVLVWVAGRLYPRLVT
jgi:ABC-2 type transport system permease protein